MLCVCVCVTIADPFAALRDAAGISPLAGTVPYVVMSRAALLSVLTSGTVHLNTPFSHVMRVPGRPTGETSTDWVASHEGWDAGMVFPRRLMLWFRLSESPLLILWNLRGFGFCIF